MAICRQIQFRNVAGSSYGRHKELRRELRFERYSYSWKLVSSASKGSISARLQAMSMRLDVPCFASHQLTHVLLVINVLSDAGYLSEHWFFSNTVHSFFPSF